MHMKLCHVYVEIHGVSLRMSFDIPVSKVPHYNLISSLRHVKNSNTPLLSNEYVTDGTSSGGKTVIASRPTIHLHVVHMWNHSAV
jgi:hypothetical protein